MPFDQSKPYTLDRVIRIGITIAIFYLLFSMMDYLSSVLVPFILSTLIAYLLFPIVRFIETKVIKSRIFATITTLFLFFGFFIGILALILPIIISQIEKMSRLITNLVNDNISGNLPDYLSSVEDYIINFAQTEEVQELLKLENLEAIAERVLPSIYGVFSGSLSFVFGLVGLTLIVFYIIFILIDYEEITDGWKDFVPASYRDRIVTLLDDLTDGMETYFRAQSIIVLIISALFAIGFSLIGLPLGIVLGIFVGLLNFVPYLQNVGFIPATFLALMYSLETGEGFLTMMGLVLLVFGVVQLIQDAFLTPKIMGDATGLNPAMILLSLTIWGKLLGMLGLLIALPVTSIIISYYRRFLRSTELKKSSLILENHHIEDIIDDLDDDEKDNKKGKIILE
ncbi:MAG: AI-2E family transporter [Saprospiraceae bacterium]